MGQTLGWYRLNPQGRPEPAADAPDGFWGKFGGRWEWFRTILEVPHQQIKNCGCGAECSYFCTGDYLLRPTDFTAFRGKLREHGLSDQEDTIFREITDWLEQHEDVYVDYG